MLGNVLSDGDGFRQLIGWRGAGSIRPSIIHDNILMKSSDLAGRVAGYVEVSCCSAAQLHKTTTQTIENRFNLPEGAYTRYHLHNTLPEHIFNDLLKTESMNYIPHGISYDRSLRGKVDFFRALTVDWMHTWLQDGILIVEAQLVLQVSNTKPNDMCAFLRKPLICS